MEIGMPRIRLGRTAVRNWDVASTPGLAGTHAIREVRNDSVGLGKLTVLASKVVDALPPESLANMAILLPEWMGAGSAADIRVTKRQNDATHGVHT